MTKLYEKLVFPFPQEINEIVPEGGDPDYIINPQAYFRGASQIPGAKFNVGFQIFVKPFFLDRLPHFHDGEEYLIFLGGTFPNVFDWDAEIEFTLGQVGVDAEVYKITQPTIIRVPAGVWHCPLNFKRVDKPVFFQAALMEEVFGANFYTPTAKIQKMRYNGPGQCKYDAAKKCDTCGKCFTEDWRS